QMVGSKLQIPRNQVFVASTGVIGRPLPMDHIRSGIQEALKSLSPKGSFSAAEAILTTDTRPKEIAFRFQASGKSVTLGGIAKGSGMIAPNMATMLAFMTTDASIDPAGLRNALGFFVPRTFNAVTVDGECSTNDMVLILANGASGTPPIRLGSPAYRNFFDAVGLVCRHLAHEIARDGEGVTRLFTVHVTGAARKEQAEKAARQVANSLLVKTMVTGRDPNWGRVAAAVGAAGVPIRPNRLTIRLGKQVVFQGGEPVQISRRKLLEEVDRPEVHIGVDLGAGREESRCLSADLTEDYIRINAKYTT
ncbi:MAG: bifunctional glutamate N-acetyltransferase/amino-acid acetyltransferase ArgJ, partial [Candidatus Omnitrophica bacterium]|nr:bifunctional glutamate N-acetyltransferase/amino-acid acetyltransferase ArgJ [Candidatus Omnitrophota bacterium]